MFEIFKKKPPQQVFRFVGNRRTFRSPEEIQKINMDESDSAFTRYKKEIIDALLLSYGFHKYKTRAYVRLNRIGLLEYIDLQKERYGSKTFCVNIAVKPLYCESKILDFSLRERLGTLISGKDVWWDYASERVAEASFRNVAAAIEQYVLPWFTDISNEDGYRAKLKSLHSDKRAKEFLNAMDTTEDKEHRIQESILELGLPKKMER